MRVGIDPLSRAAVQYWQPLIERYKIAATMVNDALAVVTSLLGTTEI